MYWCNNPQSTHSTVYLHCQHALSLVEMCHCGVLVDEAQIFGRDQGRTILSDLGDFGDQTWNAGWKDNALPTVVNKQKGRSFEVTLLKIK